MLGLEAEKTFLSCFDAGRRILWGRGNLILEFCKNKKNKKKQEKCENENTGGSVMSVS